MASQFLHRQLNLTKFRLVHYNIRMAYYRPRKIFLFISTLSCIVMGIFLYHYLSRPVVISPIPEKPAPAINLPFVKKKNPEDLKKIVSQIADKEWNNYSVYVSSLNSDFTLDIDGKTIYTAASINKLPIAAALYYLAQKGDVDLDEVITLQKKDIQDYGTGSIRYDEPGTAYSVKTLAKLMLSQSDNTAAYILANHIIGLNKIQQLINSWGLEQTDMVNNKTSNLDMYKLMLKIYKEEVTNHAFTLELLSFLSNTDFEDRIPTLLPKNVTVYHKTGNEIGVIHDVGIVVNPKIQYYIGILTSDVTDEESAVKTIESISKTVYDYLN